MDWNALSDEQRAQAQTLARARFDRLRAVVDLLDPTGDPLGWLADPRGFPPPEWVRAWAERVSRSLDTLQPGDLDPLP